jgi:hypothetical protein
LGETRFSWKPTVPYSGCVSAMYITGSKEARSLRGVWEGIFATSTPYCRAVSGFWKKLTGFAMMYCERV